MKRPERTTPFAKRSLGQNFLSDPNYARKIIDVVDPRPGDSIIEIGPGRGALTEQLVVSGAYIAAIELDKNLAGALSQRFSDKPNVRVIEQDVLDADFRDLAEWFPGRPVASDMKLVANLPYNISTAILQRLAEHRDLFSELVLMFQREVVERITAKPGDSARAFLTVIVETSFEVEKLFEVPPTAFRPVPKVWSAVVKLVPKPSANFDESSFRNIVSIGFTHKRKTILNNLKASFSTAEQCLIATGIDSKRRAESLTVSDWMTLTKCLQDVRRPRS